MKDFSEFEFDDDERDDLELDGYRSRRKKSGVLFLGASALVMLALLMIALLSQSGNKSAKEAFLEMEGKSPSHTDPETYVEGTGLRSEDLKFWKLYESMESAKESETATSTATETETKKETESTEPSTETETDPSKDGKHTLVVHSDQTEDWIRIDDTMPACKYSDDGFEIKNGIMHYYENGRDISHLGVDISKYSGDVDFERLKDAGVEFVMIRVGSRGYDTGALTLDEKFVDNIIGAEEAGMPYGAYFFSQAVSDVEAFEEVQFIVGALHGHKVTYPVAIDMEIVTGHSSRLTKISAVQRTGITNTFLQGIKNAGFIPMIYGNKEWLLTRIDMRSLQDFDVWLSNDGKTPDYPYRFSMWQYNTKGTIPGITGDACLDVSFVDYTER